MTHLEFVDKLNETGISVRSTNTEKGSKTYPVSYGLGTKDVLVDGFNVKWAEPTAFDTGKDALQQLISDTIDMDAWKHTWHQEIVPENYERFREIIQQKIIDRAQQIEQLLTVYFLLGKELSEKEATHE